MSGLNQPNDSPTCALITHKQKSLAIFRVIAWAELPWPSCIFGDGVKLTVAHLIGLNTIRDQSIYYLYDTGHGFRID